MAIRRRTLPRSPALVYGRAVPRLVLRSGLAAALLATAALAATGCGSSPRDYKIPPQPVPSGETPLSGRNATIGEVAYTAIGLRTKLGEVIGSHGSWVPHGQYVRVRLLMVNHGRERHDFDPGRQLVVTADGKTYGPSPDATQISRAVSGTQSIASQELRAFDLWFDIPANAVVRALRVFGDPSSSKLGDQLKGAPVAGTRNPVDIPLK
jgi:hypothetical protein